MAAGAEAAAAAGAEQQQRPPWVPPPASWRPPEPAPLGPVHRPYPGPTWNHPRIHQSPDCLHDSGWHDMAGAITFNGLHHAFQGCPSAGGWSHSISSDYVHWRSAGRDVHQVNETYMGMESDMTPCSGFVTVDDDGRACAGFRQCRSWRGTTSLNPAAKQWDVPMEIRCAANDNLTRWGAPEYLFPIYYYRHLPYDPPRPWHDKDGKWYLAWSSDGCNETTRALPCAAGGRLELLSAPSLRGPWTQLPPMFTTNTTCSAGQCQAGALDGEFVTTGFIGGLPGDPDGGASRVVTQNRGGATFWVGAQANGGKFQPYWDKPGAVGHYDYGDLTMARTLGCGKMALVLKKIPCVFVPSLSWVSRWIVFQMKKSLTIENLLLLQVGPEPGGEERTARPARMDRCGGCVSVAGSRPDALGRPRAAAGVCAGAADAPATENPRVDEGERRDRRQCDRSTRHGIVSDGDHRNVQMGGKAERAVWFHRAGRPR